MLGGHTSNLRFELRFELQNVDGQLLQGFPKTSVLLRGYIGTYGDVGYCGVYRVLGFSRVPIMRITPFWGIYRGPRICKLPCGRFSKQGALLGVPGTFLRDVRFRTSSAVFQAECFKLSAATATTPHGPSRHVLQSCEKVGSWRLQERD